MTKAFDLALFAVMTEQLPVSAVNAIGDFSNSPNMGSCTLTVDGRPFFPAGSPPDFVISGTTITWVNPIFSVYPGSVVIATYTLSGSSAYAPINSVAPSVSGGLIIGSTLICTQGTWSNAPTLYAYRWLRNGVNIPGATSSTYVTVATDGGHPVSCAVMASNTAGSGLATSNALSIAAPVGVPPVNTVAPVASGALTIGSTLSCTQGTWTGSPTPTYTYQWQRNGVNIPGATSSTYVTVAADGGTSVSCRVTASNTAAVVSATSNALAVTTAPLGAAWSTADASLNSITLSNGGLTATPTGGSWQSIRSTISHTTGKWYVEFFCNSPTTRQAWGMASSSFNATSYLGTSDYSLGVIDQAGTNHGSPSLPVLHRLIPPRALR